MSTPEFTITRTFDAPRELLWRAWTCPDEAPHWLHPRGFTTPRDTVAFDVREGGTYEYTMISPEGDRYRTGGRFLELSEPERIVLTWGSPEDDPHVAPVITVTLTDLDGERTEMTFHLRGIAGEPGDDDVYDGWSEALDELTARTRALTAAG